MEYNAGGVSVTGVLCDEADAAFLTNKQLNFEYPWQKTTIGNPELQEARLLSL